MEQISERPVQIMIVTVALLVVIGFVWMRVRRTMAFKREREEATIADTSRRVVPALVGDEDWLCVLFLLAYCAVWMLPMCASVCSCPLHPC
jgi:hypothetical protein